MLVLSYLGLLALIPLFVRGEDREIKWHAKNGLFLFLAYFVIAIVWWSFNFFVTIPCAGSLIDCALFFAYLAITVFGMVKALKGERLRLPVISDWADK